MRIPAKRDTASRRFRGQSISTDSVPHRPIARRCALTRAAILEALIIHGVSLEGELLNRRLPLDGERSRHMASTVLLIF